MGHGWQGALCSTDGGQSFKTISDVDESYAVGFGKAAPGQKYPAIYLSGKVSGVVGFFALTTKAPPSSVSATMRTNMVARTSSSEIRAFTAAPTLLRAVAEFYTAIPSKAGLGYTTQVLQRKLGEPLGCEFSCFGRHAQVGCR